MNICYLRMIYSYRNKNFIKQKYLRELLSSAMHRADVHKIIPLSSFLVCCIFETQFSINIE